MNTAVACYQQANRSQRPVVDEALVKDYLPLVRRVAHRMVRELPVSVEVNDLISAGCIGLIAAAERYDSGRGLDFGTFAEFRIKGAILDELRTIDPVPRRSRSKLRKLERTRRRLTGELGRPPTDDEIADAMEMPLEAYQRLLGSVPTGFDLSLTLLDRGAASRFVEERTAHLRPDQVLQSRELRKRLAAAVRQLPEKQRTVVSLYYYSRLTYREIALLFGVTGSRICQIHRAAVESIRQALESDDPIPDGGPSR